MYSRVEEWMPAFSRDAFRERTLWMLTERNCSFVERAMACEQSAAFTKRERLSGAEGDHLNVSQ